MEIGLMDHLQIVTTSNYKDIANQNTLQITTAHTKPSQSAFTSRFPVTDHNNGESPASVQTSLLSGEYHTNELTESESESYITTDCQSASLSWNKAPVWGLKPGFYYRQTFAGLLMGVALSDERTGL
jgi:uncharacterized lipoprotein NlpE involved in copper resistance